MGIHSGKFGVVDGASTVRNWSISDTQNLAKATASNTRYGTVSRKGVEDWTGSFAFYGHNPPVMPGDYFTFTGFTAPDDDVEGEGVTYEGQAVCSQVQLTWNFQSGEIIAGQADFGGHLVLSVGNAAAIFDASVPDVPIIALCKAEVSVNAAAFAEWTNLTQITLTLTNAVQTYVNSSTISSGRIWTGRKPGNLDWNASFQEQDNRRSFVAKGDELDLKLYTNATQFWRLRWGMVKDFSGLTVDRESGTIMSQTVNVEMNAASIVDGSIGSIRRPGAAADWWPYDG